MIITELNTQG